jgi:phosphate acetyltransferase
MIAGMTLQNALKGLFQEATVVVPGDRFEMIPAILMAHNATTFPDLSGLILVGGYDLPDSITKLIGTIRHDLPIAISRLTTWQAAQQLFAVEGAMTNSPRKAELALAAVSRTIDLEGLLTRAAEVGSSVTPLMFEYKLNEMARRNKRTIVLPEAEDDRILTSAAIALKRGIANIILLGKPEVVTARAEELGLDLSQAQVVDPEDPEMLERFAAEYARLRAHKGVTVEAARARFADKSYIGTMMVHMGVAHGMVSGAVNTTANTIRPSLEFIKTKPGVKVVSSSFLMCMNDRVDVYADCAVNPNPTPEELADIAIGAAETAVAFDIEPRIAMLSYSTGTSGAGGDVEAVAEATRLVRERAPELAVEGPIQFDAAIDLTVGQKKMPGSAVAGRATVFIFPDLNTGNNTYKAVQRTAGAVAIGPVLQGLNKPVNDLSRGALVEDIVNTIAITAIQAQQQ